MSAPLAEPSPDTHLTVTENVELSKCLSYRDLLCLTSPALELWGGDTIHTGLLGMSILASHRGKSAGFPHLNEGEQAPRFGVMFRAQEYPCGELPKGSGGLGMPQGMAWSSRWVLRCVCSWFCTLLFWQPGDNVCAMAWTLPGWVWALWAVLFKMGS